MKPAAGLPKSCRGRLSQAHTRGKGGSRVPQRASYGLAHSQNDSRRLGFVFNRDQELIRLHREWREDQSCDLDCATQQVRISLRVVVRTGEAKPRSRDYVSDGDGLRLVGTPASARYKLVGKLAGRVSP